VRTRANVTIDSLWEVVYNELIGTKMNFMILGTYKLLQLYLKQQNETVLTL